MGECTAKTVNLLWRKLYKLPFIKPFIQSPFFHRKAVKATLVLLPLLGITYMLFFVNPGEDDISQIVFIYFNSFLQSFQVRIMMHCDAGQCLKIAPTHRGESCCFLMYVITELFSRWLRPSYGQMIWSSILPVLLPAHCSLLTGLSGSLLLLCSFFSLFYLL